MKSLNSNVYLSLKQAITNSRLITILGYHSISNIPDKYADSISIETFRRQAEFISKNYNIARLGQLQDIFSKPERGDKRTVIVTFDDAFSDFFENAYPILERLAIPSTIFIPSGYIGKENDWDSGLQNYVKRPIMTVPQLIHLKKQGLVDFGSHSVDHKDMTSLSMEEMIRQALESRRTLEQILGLPIFMFAYPYGLCSRTTKRVLAEANYDIAVTCRSSTSNNCDNLLNLNRLFLTEKDINGTIQAKIDGMHELYHDMRNIYWQIKRDLAKCQRVLLR